MSEFDVDFEVEDENEELVEVAEEAKAEAVLETKPKSKKDPLPEGYITPVQLAKVLSELWGEDVRPQSIYGYIRNAKSFPFGNNTDGRFMVPQDEAVAWCEERRVARVRRAEEKAAAAEAEAENVVESD